MSLKKCGDNAFKYYDSEIRKSSSDHWCPSDNLNGKLQGSYSSTNTSIVVLAVSYCNPQFLQILHPGENLTCKS